jgi:hypothetical protein
MDTSITLRSVGKGSQSFTEESCDAQATFGRDLGFSAFRRHGLHSADLLRRSANPHPRVDLYVRELAIAAGRLAANLVPRSTFAPLALSDAWRADLARRSTPHDSNIAGEPLRLLERLAFFVPQSLPHGFDIRRQVARHRAYRYITPITVHRANPPASWTVRWYVARPSPCPRYRA